MVNLEPLSLAKKALRQEIAERLQKISVEDVVRQSNTICEKLFISNEFQTSKRVSVYLSLDKEVQTTSILSKLFNTGRDCFVPRYSKAGMEMVRLNSMEDYNGLPETKWKIKQPLLGEKRENALDNGGIDLVLCPGVAFTKEGDRLGHGGGYYDKYLRVLLEQMKQHERRPHVIGLALKEQIVPAIPLSDFDIKMDSVLFADID